MYLVILGGSLDHPGGVEAFCDRSKEALEKRSDIRIRRIPTSTAYLTFKKLPNYLRGVTALLACRRDRPDCIWLQYVNLPDLSYLLIARLMGFRVMVTPHLGSNWRSQSNPVLRWLSGAVLKAAHRLALISKTQELEINLPAAVPRSLIRNFLPAEILTASLPQNDNRPSAIQLIHSGRLSEGKGSFLVIEIAARLKAAGHPFFMRITGGADEATYARMREMITQHGLENEVAILGRVPEDDLLAHLKNSDLLVHPSKIDSYPLIVLEAMACSMLTVCMELAGARNMVETYGGHIVSQENAVAEAADWIISQPLSSLRQSAGQAAIDVRRDYDWSNCAGALETALNACVGRK
jgi:glycosyltransferase involved in cell wall biosynthesis